LANKSADVVNKMLDLKPPTPPTSTSGTYYKVAQNITNKASAGANAAGNVNGQSEKILGWTLIDASTKAAVTATTPPTSGWCTYAIKYSYLSAGQTMEGTMYTTATAATTSASAIAKLSAGNIFKVDNTTGEIVQNMEINNEVSFGAIAGTPATAYGSSDLAYGTSFDDKSYNDSMNQYDFDKYSYEKAITDINAETAGIQASDKSLELKLKQLDSEHSAISTELEAIKNVITKNIEATFKTFA